MHRFATLSHVALVALALAGCAANPESGSPRASTGTLIDESHDGEYDAWEVFPPTDSESSVVIAASGPDGALGAIRFLPLDDGSMTIIAESAGESSQLDLYADGSIAGEAHAPAADAMLGELIDDLEGRYDEVVALATPTSGVNTAAEEGAAREALSFLGYDLGCALGKIGAWGQGTALPICDISMGSEHRLRLFVVTPERRRLNYVTWELEGASASPVAFELAYAGLATQTATKIPRTAIETGRDLLIRFNYNIEDGGNETRTVRMPNGAWSGLRYEIVKFEPWCNDSQCDAGVCITHLIDNCSGACGPRGELQSSCTDTL